MPNCPFPAPYFVRGPWLGGFIVPQQCLLPCGVCSPPLALGRVKLHTRDEHVGAGGCVVSLARQLCRESCAMEGARSRVTPKLYGDEPFPKQPALILTLEPVPVQDPLWVG